MPKSNAPGRMRIPFTRLIRRGGPRGEGGRGTDSPTHPGTYLGAWSFPRRTLCPSKQRAARSAA